MLNAFVIIKICYVHNQWYDISCAILYILHVVLGQLLCVYLPFLFKCGIVGSQSRSEDSYILLTSIAVSLCSFN